MFSMREAVYISYGFRMRTDPLGPLNAPETNINFGAFSQEIVFYSFWEPLGLWFYGPTVGP